MSYITKLPQDAKLLVSSLTRFELDAASEVWHALRITGVSDNAEIVFIKNSKKLLKGIFGVIFRNDAIAAIEKIRYYFNKRPWIMKFSQKIVPIEFVTNDLESLLNFVEIESCNKISNHDNWKVQVNKHGSKVSKIELINKVADRVKTGTVNLTTPNWIINIEVVLDTYAVSIIRPSHIIRKKELNDKAQYNEVV